MPYHVEKIGRNEPCPCRSGKKSKRCCAIDEAPVKKKAPAPFTDAEKKIVGAIDNQRDAKEAAEKILGLDVRPKQIRGRCCLFVGVASKTFYTGYTWAGAIARLIYLRKKEAGGSLDLMKSVAAAAPAAGVSVGGVL